MDLKHVVVDPLYSFPSWTEEPLRRLDAELAKRESPYVRAKAMVQADDMGLWGTIRLEGFRIYNCEFFLSRLGIHAPLTMPHLVEGVETRILSLYLENKEKKRDLPGV